MYIKKLTGISIIALGAMSPLLAGPTVVASVQDAEVLIREITEQKGGVKASEEQFKQLVGSLIKKGTLVSIDDLVENKTPEYTSDWEKVRALYAAYEAAQNGFASAKDEPAAVKDLRAGLAAKQEEYSRLEDEDGSASLDSKSNSEKLKRQILVLEGENNDLYETLETYAKMDRVTKGKLKGLQGKAKRAKGVAADRYAGLIQGQEKLLEQNDVKIEEARQEIKKNEAKITTLKAEAEGDSAVSSRAKGLKDKRNAKKLIKKEIKAIKAELKNALAQYSTGRVNKKAVKTALSEVVVAYTQFVQKFVGAESGAQNCLEKCTELLLERTEKSLTQPEGTCSAGGMVPGAASSVLPDDAAVSPEDDIVGRADEAVSPEGDIVGRDDVDPNDGALVVVSSDGGASASTSDAVKSEEIEAFSKKIRDVLVEANVSEKRTPELKAKLEELEGELRSMRNLADEIGSVEQRKDLLVHGIQLRRALSEFSPVTTVDSIDDIDGGSEMLASEAPKVASSSADMAAEVHSPVLAIEAPKVAVALDKKESALVGQISKYMTPTKNTKAKYQKKLLGRINIEENCSKIKALSKDSRIKGDQQDKLSAFLVKHQARCS